MDRDGAMSTVEELRGLYKQGLGWKEFFDSIASYQRPVTELTAELAAKKSGLAHDTIVTGFKQLAELKIGDFRYGRRGGKTRIIWKYSPGSVGRVAQGVQSDLEGYSENDEELVDDTDAETNEEARAVAPVSALIDQAKRRLAQQLSIDTDQIEIVIRW